MSVPSISSSSSMHARPPRLAPLSLLQEEEQKDILQLLLEGHERLRRFTALAVQLGHALGASPLDLSEAASRVLRYFTYELPLHLEEEDQGLLPRLFTTQIPEALMDQLWELERQHDEFEWRLHRLMPLWAIVARTPELYPQLASRLAGDGRQLMLVVEEHVLVEERLLFPFVQEHFSQETLVELATEVLQRRLQARSMSLSERFGARGRASEAGALSR